MFQFRQFKIFDYKTLQQTIFSNLYKNAENKSKCEVREKTNKMQQLDVYYQHFSTWFGHHYANLQENKTCVTARGVLRWFCWMWLVAVVGRCLVGCEHCEVGQ